MSAEKSYNPYPEGSDWPRSKNCPDCRRYIFPGIPQFPAAHGDDARLPGPPPSRYTFCPGFSDNPPDSIPSLFPSDSR